MDPIAKILGKIKTQKPIMSDYFSKNVAIGYDMSQPDLSPGKKVLFTLFRGKKTEFYPQSVVLQSKIKTHIAGKGFIVEYLNPYGKYVEYPGFVQAHALQPYTQKNYKAWEAFGPTHAKPYSIWSSYPKR